MRLKTLHGSELSQHESQTAESEGSTVRHIHDAGAPLTEEMRLELEALAQMPDSEIDFSDIPEWTEENFRSAVRGGYRQKSAHEVVLELEDVAASWLRENARTQVHAINYALKQVVQHGRRAAWERSEGDRRPIYDKTSGAFTCGLDLLSGKAMPPLKYVEVPEYPDDELRNLLLEGWPVLRQSTFTLTMDDEVYQWLECCASTHSIRINYAIKSLAHRFLMSAQTSVSKSS